MSQQTAAKLRAARAEVRGLRKALADLLDHYSKLHHVPVGGEPSVDAAFAVLAKTAKRNLV